MAGLKFRDRWLGRGAPGRSEDESAIIPRLLLLHSGRFCYYGGITSFLLGAAFFHSTSFSRAKGSLRLLGDATASCVQVFRTGSVIQTNVLSANGCRVSPVGTALGMDREQYNITLDVVMYIFACFSILNSTRAASHCSGPRGSFPYVLFREAGVTSEFSRLPTNTVPESDRLPSAARGFLWDRATGPRLVGQQGCFVLVPVDMNGQQTKKNWQPAPAYHSAPVSTCRDYLGPESSQAAPEKRREKTIDEGGKKREKKQKHTTAGIPQSSPT